jgi:hypothetical protein
MIQLSALLLVMCTFFAFIGYSRGLSKETISMAGIILGLFALHQFDPLIRGTLLANLPPDQRFYMQSILFLGVVFFAYQTRALIGSDASRARSGGNPEGRDNLQSSVLGGIVGFVNGYLIFGTLWYFLDINRLPGGNNYPLAPYVVVPFPGSSSAAAVGSLPLYVLAGGPGGTGDLLALAVIVLFLIVLVVI